MGGASSNWPFLYHGMEHEFVEPNQYYYAGDGAYYSAQIMRSLSETAAQGTSGPGPGSGKAHHRGGGEGGGHGAAINGHINAAAIAQQSVGGGGLSEPTVQSDQTSLPLIAQLFVDIGNFFSDLLGSGGGVSYPPNYFVFQKRAEYKSHPDQGLEGDLSRVDQGPSAQDPRCVGRGRGLAGNPRTVGLRRGIPGQTVQTGSAAVDPRQFGFRNGAAIAPYAPEISGTIGNARFSGVTDVIGGPSPIAGMGVRDALEQLNPNQTIIEVVGAADQGANAPLTINVPQGVGCPTGTSPQ